MNSSLKGKKCLFFGSDNCMRTRQCENELHKYEMDLCVIYSNKRGEDLPKQALTWKGNFIFSYRNYWLLPESILASADIMAINFHPGTPEFPGSGSYSWALYNNSKFFGVTVHLMNHKFDNGKILDVYTFPVEQNETITSLIDKTSNFSVTIFQDFLKKLSTTSVHQLKKISTEPSNFHWARGARTINDIDMMRKIDINMSDDELSRRIKAFHIDKFPVYVEYNGYRFKYDGNI